MSDISTTISEVQSEQDVKRARWRADYRKRRPNCRERNVCKYDAGGVKCANTTFRDYCTTHNYRGKILAWKKQVGSPPMEALIADLQEISRMAANPDLAPGRSWRLPPLVIDYDKDRAPHIDG